MAASGTNVPVGQAPLQVYVASWKNDGKRWGSIFKNLAYFLPPDVQDALEAGSLHVGNWDVAASLDPSKPTVVFFQEPVMVMNGAFDKNGTIYTMDAVGRMLNRLNGESLVVRFAGDSSLRGNKSFPKGLRNFNNDDWKRFMYLYGIDPEKATFVEIETRDDDYGPSLYKAAVNRQGIYRIKEWLGLEVEPLSDSSDYEEGEYLTYGFSDPFSGARLDYEPWQPSS